MVSAQLTAAEAAGKVWRVGFRPEPWAWSGWEWATDGRFPGRWDDLHGNFRTIYAGSSLLACLLEVLAHFRKDARLSMELDEIVEDDEDKVLHPTITPGQVPREWLEVRAAASAELSGQYCAVTASGSVAALYPHFIGLALSLGLADFDAAALKDARPRRLTQAVAAWLYEMTDFEGVTFASRHGDDLQLWAIFERPGDPPVTPNIHDVTGEESLQHDSPEIINAFRLLGLQWEND
ncbi:RES domain-containing protein [Arthrobacter sp. YAF17]|uniref:RES domain-containing protein n=1 Tax=Arthrobacter sp. YAF17 TaxID=3233077 RepID=UPI003F91B01A